MALGPFHSLRSNTFPAKLWRLVNNPVINSILWDAEGKAVVIDRQLFEVEILSPYGLTAHNADAFKTRNFSSLIRQLNLYGFKKVLHLEQQLYRKNYKSLRKMFTCHLASRFRIKQVDIYSLNMCLQVISLTAFLISLC
uniref:HSF-type DNA-binding domain-containing protein n=1 Tax=Mola mola TaxID=94237 RepID=A0A3Q3VVM1_MOLML